jgi:hypothetical protein
MFWREMAAHHAHAAQALRIMTLTHAGPSHNVLAFSAPQSLLVSATADNLFF